MPSDCIIEVHSLCKQYKVYKRSFDRILSSISKKRQPSIFKAIDNISFSVKRGEMLGVIGPNGSGKSTLLQLIAGTVRQTTGNIKVKGRISALLELGSGFNPEFTGVENIYLNGALYGMSVKEVDDVYEDILEFSGLKDHIYQPVKHYSSGMYVRLGFAIATSVKPDVLIVDEALSVGDIRFQKKCYRRIDELKESGATILFVSHSTEDIINHCDRVIYIKSGSVVSDGHPRKVVNRYLDDMTGTGDLALHDIQGNHEESIAMMQKRSYNSHEDRWGDNRAKIVDYVLSVSGVIEPEIIESRDVLNIKCYVEFNEVVNNPVYGIDIRTLEGIRVYGTNTNILPVSVKSKYPGDKIEIIFSAPLLLSGGDYFISIGISELDSMNNPIPVERRYDFINIKIQDNNTSFGFGLLDMKIKERVN